MPQFQEKDLTYQSISTSYQDVVQRYISGDTAYFLDGYGYVILQVPTSSIGGTIVTQDQTASYSLFAVSASWAPSSASPPVLPPSPPDTIQIENGIVSGSDFTGSPRCYDISYTNPFDDDIYVVSIIGDDARIWSTSNRSTTGFTINSNSNTPINGM